MEYFKKKWRRILWSLPIKICPVRCGWNFIIKIHTLAEVIIKVNAACFLLHSMYLHFGFSPDGWVKGWAQHTALPFITKTFCSQDALKLNEQGYWMFYNNIWLKMSYVTSPNSCKKNPFTIHIIWGRPCSKIADLPDRRNRTTQRDNKTTVQKTIGCQMWQTCMYSENHWVIQDKV